MELFGTPRTDVQHFTRRIDHSEQRQYLRVPFTVHPHVDTLTIEYGYTRHRMLEAGAGITLRNEVNIVDLALEYPTLTLVGASVS